MKKPVWRPRRGHLQEIRLYASLLGGWSRIDSAYRVIRPDKRVRLVLESAQAWLVAAEREASEGRRDAAWECIHQSEATLLEAMDKAELNARFCSLQEEAAQKLDGSWRGRSAEALGKLLATNGTSPLEAARELHANLAVSEQNLHFKLALFTDESLRTLAGVISLLLGVVGLASAFVLAFPERTPENLAPWAQALLLGMVVGALGGAVSMAFSLGRTDLKRKIPDLRLTSLVTATRPLLGALVSIPVVIFVKIGLVTILDLKDLFLVLPACFLGGFSERWFLGLMERAEKLK